ncbi:MAG: polyphosphate polymerase domain-containing protein [Planctomycetota bacterium]
MTFGNRHEHKFLLPEAQALRALERVAGLLEPDRHAATKPGHSYPIASLYLDSPTDQLRGETLSGLCDRFKLRIRTYDDQPQSPLFLEIKSRRDRVVLKDRCALPRDLLPALLRGEVDALPEMAPRQRHALDEFLRKMRTRRARPRCTVRYDRQAYVGRDDPDVRVTIDRRLRTIAETQPRVLIDDPRYRQVHLHGVVMEIKFTDRCPAWLAEAVRALGLSRRSFSKYATCAAALFAPAALPDRQEGR